LKNLRRVKRLFLVLAILYVPIFAVEAGQQAWPNLAPTPPMGWANWNFYFCDYNEQTIREQADALVSSGMRDLGYRYVIIQECIARARDAEGRLVPDQVRFPHGIPALIEYIHSKGLKAGIYTDVGPYTCFTSPRYLGSYDHEELDIQTFARWGIDLVEVDYCNKPEHHTGRELYGRMAAAIRGSGRPMLLYICSWGREEPWEWARGMAQLWRTGEDISYEKGKANWKSIVRNFQVNADHAAFTAPESWNDPDMLEVGNNGLTVVESRSHYSMWAISAAPLWAGTDLTHMSAETLFTFTNAEVIAVDQDPLGAGIRRVGGTGLLQVWSKTLGKPAGASQAVMLLNLTSANAKGRVRWSDLGLEPGAWVRDLWAHKDLGRFRKTYSAVIPPHGSVLLKVEGTPRPASSLKPSL
jgi:alpha-galactosidase